MKFKQPVHLNILSRRSMKKPEDFFHRLQLHVDILQDYKIEKWGWWEPFRRDFINTAKEEFIPDDRYGAADSVHWKRSSKPKAFGSFEVARKSGVDYLLDTHSVETFECELKDVNQEQLVQYMCRSMLETDGDIAILDTVSAQYKEAKRAHDLLEGAFIELERKSLNTHTLRHWLPDIYWGTAFGPAYVELFGMENLLSCPVFRVEKLSESAVYIQLTSDINDVVINPEKVINLTSIVKNHLGTDAFFDPEKAYKLRVGIHEEKDFQRPPPIGTVFKVPEFELIDDEHMNDSHIWK